MPFSGKYGVLRKKIGKKVVPLLTLAGLRPGERLFEEKLMAEEGIKKTDNELIYIGKPIPFDVEEFLKQLEELANASYENSSDIVKISDANKMQNNKIGKRSIVRSGSRLIL